MRGADGQVTVPGRPLSEDQDDHPVQVGVELEGVSHGAHVGGRRVRHPGGVGVDGPAQDELAALLQLADGARQLGGDVPARGAVSPAVVLQEQARHAVGAGEQGPAPLGGDGGDALADGGQEGLVELDVGRGGQGGWNGRVRRGGRGGQGCQAGRAPEPAAPVDPVDPPGPTAPADPAGPARIGGGTTAGERRVHHVSLHVVERGVDRVEEWWNGGGPVVPVRRSRLTRCRAPGGRDRPVGSP